MLHAHFGRTDIHTSLVNIHEEQACQDVQNIIIRLNPGETAALLRKNEKSRHSQLHRSKPPECKIFAFTCSATNHVPSHQSIPTLTASRRKWSRGRFPWRSCGEPRLAQTDGVIQHSNPGQFVPRAWPAHKAASSYSPSFESRRQRYNWFLYYNLLRRAAAAAWASWVLARAIRSNLVQALSVVGVTTNQHSHYIAFVKAHDTRGGPWRSLRDRTRTYTTSLHKNRAAAGRE